jgi:hypothetical protein
MHKDLIIFGLLAVIAVAVVVAVWKAIMWVVDWLTQEPEL